MKNIDKEICACYAYFVKIILFCKCLEGLVQWFRLYYFLSVNLSFIQKRRKFVMKKLLSFMLSTIMCLSFCVTGMAATPQDTYISIPVPASIAEKAKMTITNEDGITENVPLEEIKLEKVSTKTRSAPYDQYRLTVTGKYTNSDTDYASGMDASVTATITYYDSGYQYQLTNVKVNYEYGSSVYLSSKLVTYGADSNLKTDSVSGSSYSKSVNMTGDSVGCVTSAMAKYGPSGATTSMSVSVWS